LIAKLTGILDSTGDDWAIVDAGGVGYLVACSNRTLSRLPAVGERVSLHVETHMRDSQIQLFGFLSTAERDWFRLLQSVQGVGAKVALAILSVLDTGELVQAIAAQDKALVARANGVGARLAARIVSELKDKAAGLALGPGAVTPPPGPPKDGVAPVIAPDAAGDAVSALVNLGYGRAEAFGAVATVGRSLGTGADVQALIRDSLKELAR
jgi:Holliday junction DNA helicase RuvA